MLKKKILFIEDNQYELGPFIRGLEDEFEIMRARNGDIGLKLLDENINEIDIIILDIMLPLSREIIDPEMGYSMGLEVAREIKKRRINIPIIVYTRRENSKLHMELSKVGVAEIVLKTDVITPESFKPIIRRHLP